MKTVSKKLFSLLLVAVLLVSALPFQAFASTVKVDFMKWNGSGYEVAAHHEFAPGGIVGQLAPAVQAPINWKFDGWVVYQANMSFDQVNAEPRAQLNSYHYNDVTYAPAFVLDTYTVTYNVEQPGVNTSGVTAPASQTMIYGYVFSGINGANAYPMPTGTPEGYSFGGWKYNDTILDRLNWSSVKFENKSNVTLQAHWVPNSLTVNFYVWSGTGYAIWSKTDVEYGAMIPSDKIPSSDDLKNTKTNYEFIGWQSSADSDAVAVDPYTARITANTNFYARYLGKQFEITLNPGNAKLDVQTKTVRLGEKVGAFGGKLPTPSLTGYVFTGWVDPNNNIVTDESIYNGYSILKATWAEQAKVYLEIKLDGNYYGGYYIPGGVQGGVLDLDNFNIAKYLPAGKTYSVVYYDLAGRNDWEANKNSTPIDNVVIEDGTTMVYAYVTTVSNNSNTTGSGSNTTGSGNNIKPADPTNPATGDNSMIYVSMTVMTLAAAALVVVMQLRKRKMI